MRKIIQQKPRPLGNNIFFTTRLQEIEKETKPAKSDLEITIYWTTENTDVDLWVTEANGETCYHKNKQTSLGGVFLYDVKQGYGPEHYILKKAPPGKYELRLHYYQRNPNRTSDITFVETVVAFYRGTSRERVQRFCTALMEENEVVLTNSFELTE